MARRYQAQSLLQQGLAPSKIATQMGISVKSVVQYLHTVIGEGRLRRSDILFSIPRETRAAFRAAEVAVGSHEVSMRRWLRRNYAGLNQDDLFAYMDVRDVGVPLEDMYSKLRLLELTFHRIVREILQHEFGGEEDRWWREGIPEQIRVECAGLQERDPEPSNHKFCYTTFIHLKEIIEKRWGAFSKHFPPSVQHEKARVVDGLIRLNRIRNRVMHPVRDFPPTEEDFEFLKEYLLFLSGQLRAEVSTQGSVH